MVDGNVCKKPLSEAIDEIYHGKVKIIAEVPAEEVEEAVTEEVTVEE